LPVFAVGFALPFAKRGECASCKNAQHLSCQHSRRVIRSRLSHRISHCLLLCANRPAFSPEFSPLYHHCRQGSAHSTGNLAHCSAIDYSVFYHVIV
jgi:hypothetical protein